MLDASKGDPIDEPMSITQWYFLWAILAKRSKPNLLGNCVRPDSGGHGLENGTCSKKAHSMDQFISFFILKILRPFASTFSPLRDVILYITGQGCGEGESSAHVDTLSVERLGLS